MLRSFFLLLPALICGEKIGHWGTSDALEPEPLVSSPEKAAQQLSLNESGGRNGARRLHSADLIAHSAKWPQRQCRRLGAEYTACSRQFAHESVFCVRASQMCDGKQNCPYADDEDPTRCLFHRLSMDEMNRIKMAFSHFAEKEKQRRQPIVWNDEQGKARDQNGGYIV